MSRELNKAIEEYIAFLKKRYGAIILKAVLLMYNNHLPG